MGTVATRMIGGTTPRAAYPSRKRIQTEMLKFAKSDTRKGLTLFLSDYTLYAGALAGVLLLDALWAKILCSIVTGVKISNLGTLAHDAAHGTLVRGIKANKWLAMFAFMPGLFNYRLWLYDHHVLHHPKVNGKHRDSFTPFSKAEFDAMPAQRRWRERLYRAPLGLGFGIYYIFERWLGVKIMPRAFMPQRVRRDAWPHFAFLMAYLALFLTGLALAPLYSSTSSATAIILGFVLPYYIWMMLIGFTLYLQHTDPRIPWFDGPVERSQAAPPELVSTHVEFPGWLKVLMHNVYDHAAHHVQPRIPVYNLAAAQARLNELMGDRNLKVNFSFGWYADTVRRCKLYDYENRRWLDFAGNPTSGVLPALDAEGEAALTGGYTAQSA